MQRPNFLFFPRSRAKSNMIGPNLTFRCDACKTQSMEQADVTATPNTMAALCHKHNTSPTLIMPVMHCQPILGLSSLCNRGVFCKYQTCHYSSKHESQTHRRERDGERRRGTQCTDASVSECTRIEMERRLSHQEI